MPLTLAWHQPPPPGRTLFVAFAYHGADRDGTRRGVLERIESPSARGHRIVHRDHYANPRPLPYVISMIVEAAGMLSPDAPPDLVLDRRYDSRLPDDVAARFGETTTADPIDFAEWTHGPLSRLRTYDNVVLVYPDALGLGCEQAERRARRSREQVLVINGRRRAFRLDEPIESRLRFSRFLARTRIAERLLATLVQPFARTLAWLDRDAGVER